MFGEEDALRNRNYTCSVACKSNFGEVFCIKSAEFNRKLKVNNESWKIIIDIGQKKE